jgi:SAM-dependent methyltransferase
MIADVDLSTFSSMALSQPNSYTLNWFQFFHAGISEARTAQEVAFICEQLPVETHPRIADLCCGTGRHARALCAAGYSVEALERDLEALTKARELGGGPNYVRGDLHEWEPAAGSFDGVIVMSQSFGYFGVEENLRILQQVATGLRAEGRVVLDLWNPDFFIAHQGTRDFRLPAGQVRETLRVEGGRLFVHLVYPDRSAEDFEWQIFTPAEMADFARSAGLEVIVACTDFSSSAAPSPDKTRLQFVFEKKRE